VGIQKKVGKKVTIIGAGLGGMAAAITCASRGAAVTLFEKNDKVGGKCNSLSINGFTFDLGPSILLLPDVFRRLFREAGRDFDKYVRLVRLQTHWKNFFEDGTVLDLHDDRKKCRDQFDTLFPGTGKQYESFYAYAICQFKNANKAYLYNGADRLSEVIQPKNLLSLLTMDLFRTMHKGVTGHVQNKYLCDIFDFFIKYVGSSPYYAPGFMNLLSGAQFKYGLWYVEGGIYNIAKAMKALMDELGVRVRLNTEVVRIVTNNNNAVIGVITSGGERIISDAVISNMEVIPAYKKLLPLPSDLAKMSKRYEPSCSAIVLHLGLDCTYPQLAHHNFFYSRNPENHFKEVFTEYRLPEDPTVYVVAASRTDSSKAPNGCDNIKVLPHIPHLRGDRLWSRKDYEHFTNQVLMKLERMGLEEIRKHIIVKNFWTPLDIEQRYNSNEGSIYGVVTDRWKNFAFKAPKQSRYYKNLFFTGGSVNPGGGMPMVVLSGLQAGKMVMGLLS
jgi:diapolycopene oxygenase